MLVEWLLGGATRRSDSLENPEVAWNDPEAWQETFGIGGSDAVGASRALTLSPVWKAVKMISGDVSKLPLEVFARGDGNTRKKDTTHPAYDLIAPFGQANEETTSLQFWRGFVAAMLLFENGYAWIERNNAGDPLHLYFLLPDRTTVERRNGKKWIVTEVGGRLEALPYADCLHVPGLSLDGVQGHELIRAAREDMAQAVAARGFATKFFKNGMHAGGILQVPPGATPKAKRKVEKAVEDRGGEEKAFKTLVLRDGFKWFQTMVDPQRAALVEMNEAKARDVANYFLLWPGHLGVRDSISYNSIEQQRRDYYDTTLSYHLTGIRAEANAKLLTAEQRKERRFFIDYNVNALLWADAETVATIGYGGVGAGVLAPDEVRGWWNLDPLPDGAGATTRVPLNTAPAPAGPTAAAGGSGRQVDVPAVKRAVKHLAADAASRICNRWAVHSGRAATRGTLREWVAGEINEHDALVARMFEPTAEAARACGVAMEAGELVEHLKAIYRRHVERAGVPCEADAVVAEFLEGVTL